MKRFAMIVLATATLFGGIGMASAQGHGGGHMGGSGGGFHGGTAGTWTGGGNWSGGNWHGGSSWNGGSWHHGGHNRVFVGVGLGWPWWGWGWGWWPGYYPYYPAYGYPYYDYPYGDYSGGYIEQGSSGEAQPAPAPSGPQYSYYCPDPAGYYPQVATCPKGWLRVLPQNAPGPSSPAPRY
jgi:hypothetical protein